MAAAVPANGVAPLTVTLTAAGDAVTYTWELGDGATAEGAIVSHVYAAGSYVATVTATSAGGEIARAEVRVTATARRLTLAAPRRADYATPGTLSGSLLPAVRGARVQLYRGSTHVTSARVAANGSFRTRVLLRSPGPYHTRYGAARSAPRTIVLRPRLEVPLPTGKPGKLRVEVVTTPKPGWAQVRRAVTSQVVQPTLGKGARGPSVLALERRLVELRYALRGVDGVYDHGIFEAVLAFQKVHGLPRTGRVEPSLWRWLATASVPRAARGGDYLQVDKRRQVMFVVRGGEVARVVHVSTGATGNTPLGSWRVYRKVHGWDWVLWYPLYFKGGFAIHGYPSVPAFPASHGCVRVPMWIARSLFDEHAHGTTVLVHL
ncbi:MAG TPA: L,D-transpeptidase family protein [Gaiellaceae bacterium]|nr:L,D-transpeptidase family protein [Gaiellaceae bacterium]